MADEPTHLRYPFQFVDGRAAEVVQDSDEDVDGCVDVILRTPVDWREELPEFGNPNPTFTSPLNLDRMRRSVNEWEPRAESTVDETGTDAFERGVHRIRIAVKGEQSNG